MYNTMLNKIFFNIQYRVFRYSVVPRRRHTHRDDAAAAATAMQGVKAEARQSAIMSSTSL